jgi:hypothetical protein
VVGLEAALNTQTGLTIALESSSESNKLLSLSDKVSSRILTISSPDKYVLDDSMTEADF